MTARLSAPVTVASCITLFARSSVAPMLQKKNCPTRSILSLPCPHAASEPGQTAKRCCYGAHPAHRRFMISWLVSLDTLCRLPRRKDSAAGSVRCLFNEASSHCVTDTHCGSRITKQRAGHQLRAAAMTARSLSWLGTGENEADVTYRSSLLTERGGGAQVYPNMSASARRQLVNRCSGGGDSHLVQPAGPTLTSPSGEPSRMFQSFR